MSVEQLCENLSQLFAASGSPPSQGLSYDRIKADPELLLCKRIEHLFECEGKKTWFKGTVLSYDQEMKEYTVAYDNEDEVCRFPLLDDFENEELKIIS